MVLQALLAGQGTQPVEQEEPQGLEAVLELLLNNPEVLRRLKEVIGKRNTEKLMNELKEYTEEN